MKLGVVRSILAGALLLPLPALAAPAPAVAADAGAPAPAPEAADGESTDDAEAGEADAPAPAAEAKPELTVPDTRASAMRAYQQALERLRLAATAPLSAQRLREELSAAEAKLADGRRDEAIGDLTYLVESPRFAPFEKSDEGRTLVFLLGDALGRAGATLPARAYLKRLLAGDPNSSWYRRGVRTLVDLGLESDRPEPFVEDLGTLAPGASDELRGDVAYLRGRTLERRGQAEPALVEYAKVTELSRFWAQATYLSGLIEVERGRLKRGEQLFCKVAEPKLTPKRAPVFGGSDFFEVRDLARLGLGRVAHEQYRFDDARYYYYLVPRDSEHLPEALYEAATTRYEAKDYDGARELMSELKVLDVHHAYEDEAHILDAYLDLATCRFPSADKKLDQFVARYEPVRDAARRLAAEEAALRRLVNTVQRGGDATSANLGVEPSAALSLAALIRIDADYGRATQRLSLLDHQLSGLRGAMGELDDAARRLSGAKGETKPEAAPSATASSAEKLARIEAELSEVRRLIREAQRTGRAGAAGLSDLTRQLETLEVKARALRVGAPAESARAPQGQGDLAALVHTDRERATQLYISGVRLRAELLADQLTLAKDALVRLDRRLTRLLARARLGRIETVLGKKRSLEVEIEALSQGLLPRTIVDSLNAERYLRDDEEYWPYDGEDWADEYVGGEGLR